MIDQELRKRILDRAASAKSMAFQGGAPPLPDHMWIRAALAAQSVADHEDVAFADEREALKVFVIAAHFDTTDDGDDSPRAALLREVLPDPAEALRRAVENNRRLLGLGPDV